jgi:hypothetical protein
MPSRIWVCIGLLFALTASAAVGKPRKGKDGKDDIVGAVWTYTLTKDGKSESGRFRVFKHEIFKGKKKVGAASPDGDETTLVFSDWPEMNGTAKLRKNRKNPPGASGTLTKEDGSEWDMKVRWKDG